MLSVRSLTTVLRLVPLSRPAFHSSAQLRIDNPDAADGADGGATTTNKATKKSRQVIDDLFSLLEAQPRRESSGAGGADADGSSYGSGGTGSVEAFEHWPLYPKRVRKWLINLRSPRGHYNSEGVFLPSGKWETEAEPIVLRPIENFHGPEK